MTKVIGGLKQLLCLRDTLFKTILELRTGTIVLSTVPEACTPPHKHSASNRVHSHEMGDRRLNIPAQLIPVLCFPKIYRRES